MQDKGERRGGGAREGEKSFFPISDMPLYFLGPILAWPAYLESTPPGQRLFHLPSENPFRGARQRLMPRGNHKLLTPEPFYEGRAPGGHVNLAAVGGGHEAPEGKVPRSIPAAEPRYGSAAGAIKRC